ncbi:C6 zinc finger [Fusarium phyllophilum]|uniref:C6 zinc finger n=1 Tax=Fusarium phyllophilum TaxID=47803 RepID=A0A8H5JLU4_9HYPO|nr:C6 zinc finger [Fusarium phyllophilum]
MQAKENQGLIINHPFIGALAHSYLGLRTPEASRSPDSLVLTSQAALQPANGIYTLQHLGLLHHFTSSTALTLSVQGQVQKLWQVDIPHIGFSFPFVIHAILALSSMHMAHELPDEHQAHWASGIELQQQAVTGAQNALNNITTENCTAVFLFSAPTCVISFARGCCHSPRCDSDSELPSDIGCESLLEWVLLYRGTRHLLGPPYEEVLHSSPLKPMFELGIERKIRLLAPLATPNTAKSIAFSKQQAVINDRVKDAKRLDAYDTTIDHLRRAFHAVYDKPLEELENMDVFAWMFAIPDNYVVLLKQQDPIALALFACFTCLIREMRRM